MAVTFIRVFFFPIPYVDTHCWSVFFTIIRHRVIHKDKVIRFEHLLITSWNPVAHTICPSAHPRTRGLIHYASCLLRAMSFKHLWLHQALTQASWRKTKSHSWPHGTVSLVAKKGNYQNQHTVLSVMKRTVPGIRSNGASENRQPTLWFQRNLY